MQTFRTGYVIKVGLCTAGVLEVQHVSMCCVLMLLAAVPLELSACLTSGKSIFPSNGEV